MNTNKKLFFVLLILLSVTRNYAQKDSLFGKNYISIGVGYPNLSRLFFDNFYKSKENYKFKGTGPYHMKYENRVFKWLGIGASINHMTYKITYVERFLDTAVGVIKPNNTEISSNNTALNLRTNFHFIDPEKQDKLDLYFGLGFGYKFGRLIINSDYPEETFSLKLPSSSRLGFEISLGVRYFFDPNIGFYLEAGLSKSIIQGGITARF